MVTVGQGLPGGRGSGSPWLSRPHAFQQHSACAQGLTDGLELLPTSHFLRPASAPFCSCLLPGQVFLRPLLCQVTPLHIPFPSSAHPRGAQVITGWQPGVDFQAACHAAQGGVLTPLSMCLLIASRPSSTRLSPGTALLPQLHLEGRPLAVESQVSRDLPWTLRGTAWSPASLTLPGVSWPSY